ncbi:MAG: hypothetical protein QG670_2206 [Thermoproteota archaeon]|nr:hypothetical protein [Thermoproteota archaeon]
MANTAEETQSTIMHRIADWRSRSIDLTRRNNLLYYKHTRRGSLTVLSPDSEAIFNRLFIRGHKWEFWLPPEEPQTPEEQPQEKLQPTEQLTLKTNQLKSSVPSRVELERILKNLYLRSLSDYRERGLRTLHIAFGILIWNDAETKEEIISPLILVPVEMVRDSMHEPFHIKVPSAEEDLSLNPALQMKLKSDYKIELPLPPEDWEIQSLADYFNQVEAAVKKFNWKVEPSVEIGLFSFYKLVIYKDLEANAELIARHQLVRRLAGDKSANLILNSLPEEKDVDKVEEPKKIFQILDADNSQRVCIDYALRGQSFVMQGPPGTGKSQTIANIIGECIAQGKQVLFVSDKMAALEVVSKRLREAGLSHFCLELHSQKANKLDVIAELKHCLDEQLIPRRLPTDSDFENIYDLRIRLNNYVNALHEKRQPLGRSVFEVLGQLSTLEHAPYAQTQIHNPRSLEPKRIQALEELVIQLQNVWQVVKEKDFPWRGYIGDTYSLAIRLDISNLLDKTITTIESLREESAEYSQKLGLTAPSTLKQVNWLRQIGNLLLESPAPEPNWVTNPNLDLLIHEARAHQEVCEWCCATRQTLAVHYNDSIFNLPKDASSELEKLINSVSKLIGVADPKTSELLKKHSELASFLSNTQKCAGEWTDYSTDLTLIFGILEENLTAERAKQLARIAHLCLSVEKPEIQWLNSPQRFKEIQEILPRAKAEYEEYNSLKAKISNGYTDGIYELDLEGLFRRYKGPYKSVLRLLRPSYYRDQKQIRLVSHDSRVSKRVLYDLVDARRSKELKAKIDFQANTLHDILGHFYQGYETDFIRVERAVAVASEIISLSGTPTVPKDLAKIASFGTLPSSSLKRIGDQLEESVIKWDQTVTNLVSLTSFSNMPNPKIAIQQTPIKILREWASETEKQLTLLCELTAKILATRNEAGPQDYKQLLEDLKNTETVITKEGEILNQRQLLQDKFGSRFSDLDTNWTEIQSTMEWTKKFQTSFSDQSIPNLTVNIASYGPKSSPSNSDLTTYYDTTLKLFASLESYFEEPLTFQGSRPLEMPIEVFLNGLRKLRERVYDLQVWIDFKNLQDRFTKEGLNSFINTLIRNPPSANQLVDVFHRAIYQEWVESVYIEDLNLGGFRRESHEQMVSEFKKVDQYLIRLTPNRVIYEANARKPQGIIIQASNSEISVLLREATKKRRIMPIRDLFQSIPNLLFRLKPCLLMSPLTVSQFLSPELMKFDLILFDEASQIVPEDAIGAMYRGKSIVVAGDNKQLPPTSFFQKTMIEDYDWDEVSEEDVEVFDSILDECSGSGLPIKTLRWHYRSKHEELISFSNHRFYGDNLITFPSAQSEDESLGVKLVYVPDGVYDRGGRRDNLREAEMVAEMVFEHFQKYPKKTLGVVTFSIAQMDAVEDAVDRRRETNIEYEDFFKEDRLQGFFIKNLENVQGDERDVMIFSVGYGRDKQGQMTLNFGPLNKPGGERRLNVAVTRAREKVILVSSIKASDINIASTNASGVLTLQQYLDYAENGPKSLETPYTMGEAESSLEAEVAEEIRSMGYNVVPQVGCSGYRIDLGVIDPDNPGHFLLGVECDGATYHSAYSARDRDRLRQQVLESLGWTIYRIWSPSWVARREIEVKRLRESLEQARKSSLDSYSEVAFQPFENRKESKQGFADVRQVKNKFSGIEGIGVPYKACKLQARFKPSFQMHISRYPYTTTQKNEYQMPMNQPEQQRLLERLVREEGPIHHEYAAQRLAEAWGLSRAGPKVTEAFRETVRFCRENGVLQERGDFLWPIGLEEDKMPIRTPVEDVPDSMRKLEYIPPQEIENAMKLIVHYAIGISVDSLITETAKVFGYNRVSDSNKERFLEVYKPMIQEGKLVVTNNTVTIPNQIN